MPLHNREDMDGWLTQVLPLVEDTQFTAATLAHEFTNLQLLSLLGEEFEPTDLDYDKVTGPAIRNGVGPNEVYVRPFVNFWTSLGHGKDIESAYSASVARMTELVETDIERVVDHVAIENFANHNRVIGYRRVLFGTVNCALCIVASTQRYHKRRLKPIHPHCDCKVAPVLSFEADDDQVLDQDLLDQIHRDIAKQFGVSDKSARKIDYRKILVQHEHGEFGPTMTYRGYRFTGPDEIN